jgi:hypothetical protein
MDRKWSSLSQRSTRLTCPKNQPRSSRTALAQVSARPGKEQSFGWAQPRLLRLFTHTHTHTHKHKKLDEKCDFLISHLFQSSCQYRLVLLQASFLAGSTTFWFHLSCLGPLGATQSPALPMSQALILCPRQEHSPPSCSRLQFLYRKHPFADTGLTVSRAAPAVPIMAVVGPLNDSHLLRGWMLENWSFDSMIFFWASATCRGQLEWNVRAHSKQEVIFSGPFSKILKWVEHSQAKLTRY